MPPAGCWGHFVCVYVWCKGIGMGWASRITGEPTPLAVQRLHARAATGGYCCYFRYYSRHYYCYSRCYCCSRCSRYHRGYRYYSRHLPGCLQVLTGPPVPQMLRRHSSAQQSAAGSGYRRCRCQHSRRRQTYSRRCRCRYWHRRRTYCRYRTCPNVPTPREPVPP